MPALSLCLGPILAVTVYVMGTVLDLLCLYLRGFGPAYLQKTPLLAGYRNRCRLGRGLGFFPSVKGLESWVPCLVAGHFPLDPLFVEAGCDSEFHWDSRVWGHGVTCSLQDPFVKIGVKEQPTCRKLSCWLAIKAKAGGGGVQGFAWRTYRAQCPAEELVTHFLVLFV